MREIVLHGLSLCSGIGGIDLGLAAVIPGYRTVCYVERELYCASILAAQMEAGSLDEAPIWDDLRSFDPEPWRGCVDIIHGGFPCQPFSAAGRRKGNKDSRHLWPIIAGIVGELRPTFAFFENVPGFVSLGLRDVCTDLRSLGYDISAGIFSAAECGAPHLRKRLFILAGLVAHTDSRDGNGRPEGTKGRSMVRQDFSLSSGRKQGVGGIRHCSEKMADAHSLKPPLSQQPIVAGVGRASHGLSGWLDGWEEGVTRTLCVSPPNRIDRLHALGNAVVPRVAALAWSELCRAIQPSRRPEPECLRREPSLSEEEADDMFFRATSRLGW